MKLLPIVNHNRDLFDKFVPIYNQDTTSSDETNNLISAQTVSNKFECAQKCSQISTCKMISFKSNQCKLFKQVKYSLSTNTTRESILYEKYVPDYSSINSYLTNHWPFNNDFNDIIGGATLYNPVSCSFTTDRLNTPSSALFLNRGYVRAPTGIYFNGDFTMTVWVKLLEYAHKAVVAFGTNQQDDVYLGINYNSLYGERINYYISNAGIRHNTFSQFNLKINVWQHYAITLSGTTATIYVDGKLNYQDTSVKPRSISRTSNYVGCSNWPDCSPYAYVDDLKIFNRSLTQAEILMVMNSYY